MIILAACGGGGDGAASDCSEMDKALAAASITTTAGAVSTFSDVRLLERQVAHSRCLTTNDARAAFEEAKDMTGDSCAQCVTELDRAEDDL